MAGRYGDLNYSRAVKTGVVLGGLLLITGFLGESVGHMLYTDVTGTLDRVFTAMEFVGIGVAIIAVFVFGIALPLTE